MNIAEIFNNPIVQQFLRFSAVGAAATGVHYGILVTLVEVFQLHSVLATSVGFAVGALLSFLLNKSFTFRRDNFSWHDLAKYYGVTTVGMLLNGAIVASLLAWDVYYLFAQVVATGAVLVFNFLSARFVVFRDAVKPGDRTASLRHPSRQSHSPR